MPYMSTDEQLARRILCPSRTATPPVIVKIGNRETGRLEESTDTELINFFAGYAVAVTTQTGKVWESGDEIFNDDIDGVRIVAEVF